jgi:hypothetical protein
MAEVFEVPPSEIADLAAACVRFVHDALGLTLDYTPETLPILDHYLKERGRGAATAPALGGGASHGAATAPALRGGASPAANDAVLDLLTPAAGAYFGEVVRRHMPGSRWYAPEGDYPAHRLEFDPFFLCFNPIGVAREVLIERTADGYGAHFQVLDEARDAVRRSLDNNEVAPDDYYTLSVRLEAIEQIADLLSAMESGKRERRRFGPEIYRAVHGEPAGNGQPS